MDVNRKLLETLLDLHGKTRSGILRISRDSTKKQLVLDNGLLAYAESNLPQEHLAHVMLGMHLFPRPKLKDVASLMKAGKTSEEAILALPESSRETLEKGRREQAILILTSLLNCDGCEFRLHPLSEAIHNQLSLRMKLPELIVASVRRAISKRLLTGPPNLFGEPLGINEDSIGFEFPLNDAERSAYSLLKTGKHSSEVLASIPEGESRPEQILLCLYYLGLIRCVDKGVGNSSAIDSDPAALKIEELLTRFESADLYEVLSVSQDAGQDDIQAAYHEQAKQLHPDRFQSGEFSAEIRGKAERVFARINEAYHTLKNQVSRAEYDLQLPKKKAAASAPKTGLAQNAETAEGFFREGRSLLAKGDFETAVERLRGCVWLCPGKAAYHYYLGIAEARIPKYRKSAEQHLLRSIELEDMSADGHLALARLYIDVKLSRKAEQQLQQALLWDPHNSEAQKLAAELRKMS